MEDIIRSQDHITLLPCDVLLFKATWIDKLFITYSHVAMFYGYTVQGIPLIVESISKGALIRSIFAYAGKEATVLRPIINEDKAHDVIEAARNIVDSPNSYYDYLCIVQFAVPRLILEVLGLPLPYKYHRNPLFICSELVAESYWRAGLNILSQDIVPLPDDFTGSGMMRHLGEVIIT